MVLIHLQKMKKNEICCFWKTHFKVSAISPVFFVESGSGSLSLSLSCFTESDTCPALCSVFCRLWARGPAAGRCRSSVCGPAGRAPRTELRTPPLCSLSPPAASPAAPGTSAWTLCGAARVRSRAGAHRAAPAPRTLAPDSRRLWRRSRTERSRYRAHAAPRSATPRAAPRASPPCSRRPPSARTPSAWIGAAPFWPRRSRRAERALPRTKRGRRD